MLGKGSGQCIYTCGQGREHAGIDAITRIPILFTGEQFTLDLGGHVRLDLTTIGQQLAILFAQLVIVLALTGIFIAWKKYAGEGETAWKRDEKFEKSFIYQLVTNQYYVPKFYDEFIVQPYTLASAKFWEIDKAVVDGFVDFIGKASYKTGDVSRGMQNGNLSSYLNWMGVGALIIVLIAAIASVIG